MKKYKITYYRDGIQHTAIVEARSRREALQKAWSMVDTDDVYVSEVSDEQR